MKPSKKSLAAVVVIAVLLAGLAVVYRQWTRPVTLDAIFANTTGIYEGDDVRVAGVKVGRISSIVPQGQTVRMSMEVDRGTSIPSDASAIVVAQNLVADRFVQLTPAHTGEGPVMDDGATIPRERTAVPVEWDEVKEQLTRLATDLGPQAGSDSSVGRFVDSSATALEGNGETLGRALRELSDIGRVLADNTGNVTDTIRNLSTFVDAVKSSGTQIVQFENRLATMSEVLNGSRSDLDAALTNLSVAVGDVQRFVASNREGLSEQVTRLSAVTQNLVDSKGDLEQLLHVFPSSMANFYNIYNPDVGTEAGVFTVNNFSNPVQFICSSVASIENLTAEEGARRCAEYLGPIAPMLTFNYLPVPLNPVLGPTPTDENLIYTEPELRPTAPANPTPTRQTHSLEDLLAPLVGGGTP
ncbi:MCE family protein [Rhodococcus sp. NPDC058521]|uniref:MCE family protein n=1 Tax=Rhodococcus sp. NPDC058521 TaxID=3346536 RepID=UPI003658C4B1